MENIPMWESSKNRDVGKMRSNSIVSWMVYFRLMTNIFPWWWWPKKGKCLKNVTPQYWVLRRKIETLTLKYIYIYKHSMHCDFYSSLFLQEMMLNKDPSSFLFLCHFPLLLSFLSVFFFLCILGIGYLANIYKLGVYKQVTLFLRKEELFL